MPFALPSYRVRLQSDYPVPGSIIDRLTGIPLRLPKASAWKIEVGIFAGLNRSAPSAAAQVVSTSGWVALTVTFQSSSGTNVVSKTTGSFTSLTFATWNDDTAYHALVELSSAEANIATGRYKVTVVVDDYVVGTGDVEVFDAYNLNTLDPADENPGAPISQDAADLRYAPLGGAGGGIVTGIVGLTGGGATKLDGQSTVGSGPDYEVGEYVTFDIAGDTGGIVSYKLRAGTDAENSPYIIRPDDYASQSTNLVWEKRA